MKATSELAGKPAANAAWAMYAGILLVSLLLTMAPAHAIPTLPPTKRADCVKADANPRYSGGTDTGQDQLGTPSAYQDSTYAELRSLERLDSSQSGKNFALTVNSHLAARQSQRRPD
jgi:hypothetical protein